MRMKKRLLSLLLTACLIAGMLPQIAFAAATTCGYTRTITPSYTAALTFLADGGIRIQVSGNSRSDDKTYTKEEFFTATDNKYDFVVGTADQGGNIYDELLTWKGSSSELLLGSDISSMEGGLSWNIIIEDGADTSVIQSLQICKGNTITRVTGSLGCSVSNNGTITDGTFDGEKVENDQYGQITGGTFNGQLTNYGSITGGVFNNQVKNYKITLQIAGSITGGTFNHLVTNASSIDNTDRKVVFGPNAVYVSSGGTVTGVLVDSAGNAVATDTYAITYSWRGYVDAILSGFSTYKTGEQVTLPKAEDLAGLFGVPEAAVNDGWYYWNDVFNEDGSPKADNIYEQLQLQGKAMKNTLDTTGKSDVLRLWCRWQYPLTVKNGRITHVNSTAVGSETAPVTSGIYFDGDVISISADSPGEGSVFFGWSTQYSDDNFFDNASAPSTTFSMEEWDITVTAVFHTHTYALKYDETHHYELCTDPSCPSADKGKKDNAAHNPGTAATCNAPQTCTDCGQPYGNLNSSNHTGGTEIRGAVEATYSAAGYTGDTWCLGCNTQIDSGEVIPRKILIIPPVVPDTEGDDSSVKETEESQSGTKVDVSVGSEDTVIEVGVTITETTAKLEEIAPEIVEQLITSSIAEAEIVIDLTALEQDVTTVTLPTSTIETIVETAEAAGTTEEKLTIKLVNGTVELDDQTMQAIVTQAEGNEIQLVLESVGTTRLNEEQQQAVADKNVFGGIEAYLYCVKGQKRISDFKGGEATLRIPFEIPADHQTEGFSIWYIDDEGNAEKLTTWYEDGHLVWDVSHFSDFIIVYDDEDEETESGPSEPTEITLDTSFRTLRLEVIKTGKNFLKLQWAEMAEADGYVIYGAPCNTGSTTHKIQRLKVIKDGHTAIWTHRGLEDGTFYKYYVKAYKLVDGRKVFLAKSRAVHAVTTGGKYANASYVDVNAIEVNLQVGESFTIEATEVAKKKKLKQHTTVRFESDDATVAAVGAKNGTITAKTDGNCIIWVYAQNGEWATVNVTVE